MKSGASGQVVHLELHTPDLDEARSFYTGLCGWRQEQVHTGAGSYLALDLSSDLGGGIVQCATRHALWLPYVEVGDIHEATDRAQVLGARVMLAPREGPVGWRGVVATPAAGEIALWQPKR
jgi:uncharacterized protein